MKGLIIILSFCFFLTRDLKLDLIAFTSTEIVLYKRHKETHKIQQDLVVKGLCFAVMQMGFKSFLLLSCVTEQVKHPL